jgi:hypothetical protein
LASATRKLFGSAKKVAAYERAARHGEIDLLFWVQEGEANFGVSLDLIILQTASVCKKPNDVFDPVWSSFQGSRAQATFETGRHHANADLFDDMPNAVDAFLVVACHACYLQLAG